MATVKTAHTTSSIRARSRAAPARPDPSAVDRKVVYKPVVDNPLAVRWPPLPASVRNEILNQLLQLIQSAERPEQGLEVGSQKTARTDESRQSTEQDDSQRTTATTQRQGGNDRGKKGASRLALLSDLVVGINQVTRALESRIRWGRWELGDSHAAPPATPSRPGEPDVREAERETERGGGGWDGGGGRKRKRKHHASSSSLSSAAAAASSASSVPALPLGDHPAYSFLHDARTSPSRDVLAPYFCLDQSQSLATSPSSEPSSKLSSPRILVNSDARRLAPRAGAETGDDHQKKTQKEKKQKQSAGALLPAHPGVASSETSNAHDDGLNAAAISKTEPDSSFQPPPPPTVPLVDLVFVCKPDINPPSLVAHLPTMVAAANGVQTALDSVLLQGAGPDDAEAAERMQLDAVGPGEEEEKKEPGPKRPEMRPVLLIPLDVGAERKLADALGLRRVAAIAVSSLLPAASALYSLIQSHKLQPLSTPWLVPYLLHPHAPSARHQEPTSRFAPTTIKHVKTSAPLNPKAGVQQRKEARKEKKDAIVEMKRKKRKVALEKARASGGGGGGSAYADDDVYIAED
ncbi:hypothetical protein RHOSPDRAFT_31543 [Rhodotorula sp. JG-1b]|nr:hypothetical protein RHOSPDRAFT_31543 [Rhodotorula sp. JG-1b]